MPSYPPLVTYFVRFQSTGQTFTLDPLPIHPQTKVADVFRRVRAVPMTHSNRPYLLQWKSDHPLMEMDDDHMRMRLSDAVERGWLPAANGSELLVMDVLSALDQYQRDGGLENELQRRRQRRQGGKKSRSNNAGRARTRRRHRRCALRAKTT